MATPRRDPARTRGAPLKTFHCDHCNQQVFCENVSCERCGHLLGFVEETGQVYAVEREGDDTWRSLAPDIEGRRYRQCHNYAVEQVCNRMIPRDDPETLCQACRLTTIIPSLASQQNRTYWYRLERAKPAIRPVIGSPD